MRSIIQLVKAPPSLFPLSTVRAAFRYVNILAAILCFFLQLVIDSSEDNLLCATLAALAVIVTSIYCFREAPIQKRLYSTMSVYGACLVAVGLALFGMTPEWRPLTFNLEMPVLTFGSSFAVLMILIAAHALFSQSALFRAASAKIRDTVYRPIGLLRIPGDLELWLLGAIGVLAILASGTGEALYGANSVQTGDVGGKFLQSLAVFAIAPYIIAFKSALISNKSSRPSTMTWSLLGLYFIVILGLAVARNQRNAFAEIVLIIIVCTLMALLSGGIRITSRTLMIGGAILLIGIPSVQVMGNLSEAIKMVRADRASLSTGALVAKTMDAMAHPEMLEYMKDQENVIASGYSETYFKSEFFTRFATTKYVDINWSSIGGFPDVDPTLHDKAVDNLTLRLLALLPEPVLKFFHIQVDKTSLQFASSTGDMYINYASMKELGSFLTGSVIGDTYVLFGPLALFAFFAVFLVYFVFVDSFLKYDDRGGVFVLPFSVLLAAKIFQAVVLPEAFAIYVVFFMRTVPQLIVIYALFTQGTYIAFSWIGRPAGARAQSIANRLRRRA